VEHARLRFNTVPLRRQARHLSEAGQSRKRRLESSLPAPPELRIHDFIKNLNTTRLSGTPPAAAPGTPAASAAATAAGKRKLTSVELLRLHQVDFMRIYIMNEVRFIFSKKVYRNSLVLIQNTVPVVRYRYRRYPSVMPIYRCVISYAAQFTLYVRTGTGTLNLQIGD
jgi:hypothetical protein